MGQEALHDLIADARVYDLGQCYWNGMPVHPFDPPYQYFLFDYHEHVLKDLGKIEPGFSHAIGMLITSMHAGTHFDAPHHWITGKDFADGYTDTIAPQNFVAPVNVIDTVGCSRDWLNHTEIPHEKTMLPSEPSMVLPLLTCGMSLCLPSARPRYVSDRLAP